MEVADVAEGDEEVDGAVFEGLGDDEGVTDEAAKG